GDLRRDEGVGEEGGRNQEAVEPRGPGVGRQRILSEVKIGEGGVGDLRNREPGLESVPDFDEGGWKRGESPGGVLLAVDEVEIATNEGVDGGVGSQHSTDKALLNAGLVRPGPQVDVEELERLVGGGTGDVTPQLDIALEVGRERDVGGG